ncbi:MAG: hypothetical protein GXO79_14100 [Chlorobi bacterium]|nr:hypothetical protein [Chlorobiota bacterium]
MLNIVFILLIEIFSGFAFHPLHISITNIENDTINMQLNVSIKMFKNDLTTALLQNYNNPVNTKDCIFTQSDSTYLNKYLNSHFSTNFANDKILHNPKISGIKCNDDSIWLSFSFSYNKKISTVEIKNTILFDLYADQNNLMIIKNKNEEKGYQLNHSNSSVTISL